MTQRHEIRYWTLSDEKSYYITCDTCGIKGGRYMTVPEVHAWALRHTAQSGDGTYDETDAVDPTNENAQEDSAASNLYLAFSGDSYLVSADSMTQAHEKYKAWMADRDCPCGVYNCDCVRENECMTHIERW